MQPTERSEVEIQVLGSEPEVFKPGLVIQRHDHAGPEYTVTFTGAFDDAGVRYGRGHVCVREAGDRHIQRILPGEACVVLAVNHGPLVPLTLLSRLMNAIGDRRSARSPRKRGRTFETRVRARW